MASPPTVVGPDLYPGQGNGVPDSAGFNPEDKAPGWRLGNERWNVIYFDLAVSVALGGSQPDDWKILKEQLLISDPDCDINDVEWVDGDRRLIDYPDLSRLPVDIRVLIESTVSIAATGSLPTFDSVTEHWVYSTGTTGSGDLYISDELKLTLEAIYGWTFSIPTNPFSGTTQYHDLRLCLDQGISDGDVLYLKGYEQSAYSLSSIVGFQAQQNGDCDTGIEVTLTWTTPDDGPNGPPVLYNLWLNVGGVPTPIGTAVPPSETFVHASPPAGEIAMYGITWEDGDGIESSPSIANAGYIDSCDPNNAVEITATETGECFEDGRDYLNGGEIGHGYVAIDFTWSPPVPTLPPIEGFKLERLLPGGSWTEIDEILGVDPYNINNLSFYDYALSEEPNPNWYLSCTADKIVEYRVSPFRTVGGSEVNGFTATITVEIPCCSCDDYDGSDDIECPVDECWYDPDKDATIWFSDYNPDIAESLAEGEPHVSFNINYCISDNCAKGVKYAFIKLDLPDGRKIIHVDVPDGVDWNLYDSITYDPNSANAGQETDAGDIIEIIASVDPQNWLSDYPPVSNVLCTVWIDELIGTENRICIDDEFEKLELKWIDSNNVTQEYSVDPDNVQLGPCLSQCTGEVDMGYGDYYFEPVAVDNDTFDIKYCLTRDEIDTFFIPVLIGDFTSNIDHIHNSGDWYEAGWKVGVMNPVPGLSIIVGHGTNPTIKADKGFSTLLTATLNNQLVGDECICILPFFLKLGDLFKNTFGSVDSLVNLSDKSFLNMSRQMSGGDLNMYAPVNDGTVGETLNFNRTATTNLVKVFQNMLDNEEIDPRFREIYNCILDSLKEAYIDQRKLGPQHLQRVIIVAFLFLLLWKAWLTFASLFDSVKKALDVAQAQIDKACVSKITLPEIITSQTGAESVPDICCWTDSTNSEAYYAVPIYYESSCSIAGAQFELKIPSSFQSPVELIRELPTGLSGSTTQCPLVDGNLDPVPYFLTGIAKDKDYIQAFSSESGKYLCVYDKPSKQLVPEKDFILANVGTKTVLTTILIKIPGQTCSDADIVQLREELEIVQNSVKIVTNEGGEVAMTSPISSWSGNIYTSDEVDGTARMVPQDLVATIAVAIDACTSDELDDPSLFIDTVSTSPILPLINFDCSYSVVADANGDSVIDITDVVTTRNLFARYGFSVVGDMDDNEQELISEKIIAITTGGMREKIVPRTCCPSFSLDFDVFVPDECSDFCVPLDCFGGIWIENVTKLRNGLTAIDVFYSTSCDKNSGFQFELHGINKGVGIHKIDDSVGAAAGNKYNLVQELYSGDGSTANKIYIAYAASEDDYVPRSKGLLVRLLISSKAWFSSAELVRVKSARMVADYQAEHNVASSTRQGLKTAERIYRLFGLQTRKWRILSNADTVEPVGTWTGDFNNDGNSLEDLNYLKRLVDFGKYESRFDAEGDKVLGVADIQAVYHSYMTDSFGNDLNGDTFLPLNCCPCRTPEKPELELLHYASKDEDVPDRLNERWRELFDCNGGRLSGGVILIWDNLPDANYYEIWRQRDSKDPFAAKPMKVTDTTAIRRQFGNFLEVAIASEAQNDQKSSMHMEIGAPRTFAYVDFPATAKNMCCEPCDPLDSDSSDSDSDSGSDDDCESATLSKFRYWIVAYNNCGETTSDPKTGIIPCCQYNPIAYNDKYTTTMNQGLLGNFKAYHPLAHEAYNYPPGVPSCKEDVGECIDFAFKAPHQSETTVKGGKVIVAGNLNDGRFKYIPKNGFVGIDGFKFMVCAIPRKLQTIQNSVKMRMKYGIKATSKSGEDRTYNINQAALKRAALSKARMTDPMVRLRSKTWRPCCDVGSIRVDVLPPCPVRAKGRPLPCDASEYSESVILEWGGYPPGIIESFNVYRLENVLTDWILLENVPNDGTMMHSYLDENVPHPLQEPCEVEGQSFKVYYGITSVAVGGIESPHGCPEACLGVPCEEKTDVRGQRCCFEVKVYCCPDIPTPDITINNYTTCEDESNDSFVAGNRVVIKWDDVPGVEYYQVYRYGPFKEGDPPPSKSDYKFLGGQAEPPVNGKHIFIDTTILPCQGCDSVMYTYVVTSVLENAQESEFGENAQDIEVLCCNEPPTAYDQEFTTKYDTNITKNLLAIDADSNIASYHLVEEPWSGAGEIISFDEENGSFTFDPETYFVGNTTFVWKVVDECGESDEATVTITVKDPDICDEDDYVICNAVIPWLTDQQDVPEIRIRIAELPQVPFILNTKGVPSLRKRCMSYCVTCGIDPMIFGRSRDGCVMFIDEDTPTHIVAMFCDETIPFTGQCLPTFIGIPEDISIECEDGDSFSDCKPTNVEEPGDISLECDLGITFTEDCKPTKIGISGVHMFCDLMMPLSHGCLPVGFSIPTIILECNESIEFIDVCKILKLGIPEEPLFICEDGITFTDNECAANAGITEGLFFGCYTAISFTETICEETECDSDSGDGEGED